MIDTDKAHIDTCMVGSITDGSHFDLGHGILESPIKHWHLAANCSLTLALTMLSFSPEKNTITCIYLFFSPIITCPHPTKRPNQQQGQGLIITPHGSSSLKKKS